MLVKSKWSAAWLHYISIAFKLAYSQDKQVLNKLYTIDSEICSILIF